MSVNEVTRPEITPRELRRTVAASVVGTIAEYYDFFIYGTASALVFSKIFFPEVDPLLGTLAAFSTYAVGFFARPLGGLVWGHIGDRLGRKRALVFTLLLTGLGTFAVGLMPTYDQIGIWAAVLLVIIRLIQGFGVGGEQGGAILLTAEAAPRHRRGFYASFVQLGSPAAYLVPTVLFASLEGALTEEQFLTWGWRIPFLMSAFVVVIGLWIRSQIDESATFKAARAHRAESASPLKHLLGTQRRVLVGGFFAKFAEAAVFPFYTAFLVAYANFNDVDDQVILNAVIVGIVAELIMLPLWGRLTDKVGRRPVMLALAIVNFLLVIPGFLAVQTENFWVMAAFLTAGLAFGHAGTYAPQASYFPELFDSSSRYSGVSVVWQFGAMVASGPFTVVGTALLVVADGGFGWVALYAMALIACSIVALVLLPETAPGRRGGREYADWPEQDAVDASAPDEAVAAARV